VSRNAGVLRGKSRGGMGEVKSAGGRRAGAGSEA
jgi:hypothetical protein